MEMFIRISSVLKTVPRRSKSGDSLLALQVRGAAKKILEGMCVDLGEDVAGSVKVKSFKNGVLNIVAPGLLSTELYMRSSGLKKEINRVLGEEIIGKIRFKAS